MSTTPEDSWADAGLVPPEDARIPTPERGTMPVDPARQPAAPRPDLAAEAAEAAEYRADPDEPADADEVPAELPTDAGEADALEQALGARGLPPEPPRARDDAAEHDLIEQAQDVPDDDEEYPTA
ncbi:hypothetical protein [Actinotalea fermentans]|uniref:DUF5709 domain-containing protein n=1 Tax=Actinotalea fermentans TaxID=43671 RepID=A0A511YWN6_9CELL|nr:hypothetical protein [Actinotalea fermentans]GEN79598.1 hypothetical protein AFE02nite_13320 [Actinotalea fermentans]